MNNKVLFDDKIVIPHVRLIDGNRNMVGNFNKEDAIQMARETNMNLIQISETQNESGEKVAICVIQDYRKYLYNKNRESKKAKSINKEITIGSKIDVKDMIRKLDYISNLTENTPVTLVISRRRRVDYLSVENFVNSYFMSKDSHNIKLVKQTNREIRFYITKKKK